MQTRVSHGKKQGTHGAMSTITPARRGRNADIRLRQLVLRSLSEGRGYGGQVAGNDDQLTLLRPLVEAHLELRRFKNLLIGREGIFEFGEEGVAVVFSFYQR